MKGAVEVMIAQPSFINLQPIIADMGYWQRVQDEQHLHALLKKTTIRANTREPKAKPRGGSVTGRGFIRIVLIALAVSAAVGLSLSIKNSQAISVFLSSLQLVLILQLSLLLEV